MKYRRDKRSVDREPKRNDRVPARTKLPAKRPPPKPTTSEHWLQCELCQSEIAVDAAERGARQCASCAASNEKET